MEPRGGRPCPRGLRVALVDPRPLARWRNNYGVWVDEFEALDLSAGAYTRSLFSST